MKNLIIIHRDLQHLYTGGQYQLAQIISFCKRENIKMQVIDCSVLPEKVKNNRLLFVLYFTKYFLEHRKNIFTFTDHSTHFRLLVPLFISRMFGGKYGLNCLQTFYNFRRNIVMQWVEFICEHLFLHCASLHIFPSEPAIKYFRLFRINHKTKSIVNPAAKILCNGKVEFRNQVRNLIFVGQVKQWKGLDVLIHALSKLKHLNLKLDVVGSYDSQSKYCQSLVKIIQKNNLERNVIFHGNLSPSDLAVLYKNADIYILSSRYETFGIVLLEAMSFGLPIISSTIPSAKQILKSMTNGIFYETENPEALAQAIETLSINNSLRKQIHKNNLRASVKPRTWEMVADETFSAIEKFLID